MMIPNSIAMLFRNDLFIQFSILSPSLSLLHIDAELTITLLSHN